MKIGLITFHDTTNFGSLLQTYGLYKAIVNCDKQCEIIDYQCQSIVERELPPRFRFTLNIRKLLRQFLIIPTCRRKHNALSVFLTQNMHLSGKFTRETIHNANNQYDKFIVGSDIVWGLDITKGDTAYFLDFVKGKSKKYAFASSIGNPWSEDEKTKIKPLLNDFNHICVREEESAEWVEELTKKRPDVVSDPTMLLNPTEWKDIASDKYKGRKYVFLYFNDSNNTCLTKAKEYAKSQNIEVLYVNYGKPIKGVKSIRPYSIADFLSLILYAQHIFTSSYHGMLFSIYFQKQFIFFNRAHKSRMNTLAKKLNIYHCNGADVDTKNLPIIDYSAVNQAVSVYRNYSLDRLKHILTLE